SAGAGGALGARAMGARDGQAPASGGARAAEAYGPGGPLAGAAGPSGPGGALSGPASDARAPGPESLAPRAEAVQARGGRTCAGPAGWRGISGTQRDEGEWPPLVGPRPGEGAAAGRYRSAESAGHRPRGPVGLLAAERARQARIVVVGPVTERWAPEQAGPVHENWQLAPPVGPATDLWALGALLFRSVQGHAPYPEESAAELVELVCSEAPAYAEECGALRPVVESLLRQDPAERPDFEELRGWLRSLIRSAPEPELGSRTVTVPSFDPGAPGDHHRLPVVRRRGELVRRRRAGAPVAHGRHKRARKRRGDARRGGPRALGRLLLGLVLVGMIVAIASAMAFLPRAGENRDAAGTSGKSASGSAGSVGTAPTGAPADPTAAPDGRTPDAPASADRQPQRTETAGLAEGYEIRKDPEGFRLAVPKGWERRATNARSQVRYVGGDFELVVVPGRDAVQSFGADPMAYQQDKEEELAPFRQSQWSAASGLRRIDIGRTAMAEGTFSWKDGSGRQVRARNLAMIVDGRYHVVLVIGPDGRQEELDRHFGQATATYRTGGG
ncbi:protein kinase, partial [Streptomyces sp. URMC 123]